MDKEDLAEIIVEHVKQLEDSIIILKKEIAFVKYVIEVKKKHGRNLFEENKKITELETQLETEENTKDNLEEIFKNHDIEFKDIEKLCM